MAVLGVAAAALLSAPAAAQTAQPDHESGEWQFTATIYGSLPTISGKLAISLGTAGDSIHIDTDTHY